MPIKSGREYSRGRRIGVAHVIGALVASGAVAGLLVFNFTQHRDTNVALAKDWAINGPPCPSLTRAEFEAKGFKAPKSFDYDDLTMARKAGHASCSDIQQGGGKGMFHDQACQFTSPAALIITTKKGEFFYTPEVGQPATVYVHDGVPKCVLGGKFTLKGEG
jgi:hypothetical protein